MHTIDIAETHPGEEYLWRRLMAVGRGIKILNFNIRFSFNICKYSRFKKKS